MPEKIKPRDDERLREAGFLPEGDRHLGEMISGPLLWHHVDERSRTFTTAEALERLAEREGDGMAELRFPVRDREDDLAFDTPGVIRAAISQGKIDETEGSIVRELCMRLLLDGCRIFGEAEDRLEAMGPRGQREILDRARVAVGLNTIADEEAERRFQVANSFPGPLLSGIDLPDSHSMTELRGRRAANARWKERAA